MAAAIELIELTKRYGNFEALSGVSLQIERGAIFGFPGHNGAGKTTTINILTTLLAPTAGSASVSRSRVVSFPRLCWAATRFSPPPARASARRASSFARTSCMVPTADRMIACNL